MKVIGTFQKSRNFGFVIPDNKDFKGDIFISKSNRKKAKNNQRVVVEITKKATKDKSAEGKIISVFKELNEVDIDLLVMCEEFNLPNEFPKEVLEQAKCVSKKKITSKGRKDYRKKEIFTIDGEDAKDLDDAISVEINEDGTYTLGVYIADVSHYVREETALDYEAIIRGTSVYMFDRVIPMLPTQLSNGCCSLNQGKDRYAISVIMQIDKKGNVTDSEIQKAIINVTKRMSYNEVTAILNRENTEYIDNKNKYKTQKYVDKVLAENEDYFKHFDKMKELADILKKRREKNGYISLDIPETKITYSKIGKPLRVEPYETTISNEIIEQFMLTANETVAERFYWLGAPFIYRVHDKPEAEKIQELNKYLWGLGYRIKGKKDNIMPKAFAQALEQFKGKEEENVVSNLLLRTLKIARYEATNKGHFGIASKYYCHFTSPIRRYPDLFIHRVISKYLENNYNISEECKEQLLINAVKYSESSSNCEQNATKAERESIAMKSAEYMEKHIDEEFDGIVSGITKFGMFVELQNTIEGLIRFENMGNEYFIFDENKKTFTGEQSKIQFKLGDKVRIRVLDAKKNTRKCSFQLIEKLSKTI